MKSIKKMIATLLSGVLVFSLAACSQTPQVTEAPNNLETMGAELIEQTKDMTREEYLNFAGDYALNAKEIVPFSMVNAAKKAELSPEDIISVYQFEWVNIIYNISKYQSLLGTYSHMLQFNDDGTLDYEATKALITDGVFEAMYEGMTENGLKVLWRNDSVYVTTDVLAFKEKVKDDVDKSFTDYLDIVHNTDSVHFIKDSKLNYDNILNCMIFEEGFLREHQENELWETIYQQFYAQFMMYTGLYGTGGFLNEDGSYNSDFETRFKQDIEANYGTYFASVGAAIIDQLAGVNKSELTSSEINTSVTYCIDNEFADEMIHFLELYGDLGDTTLEDAGTINGDDSDEIMTIYDGTETEHNHDEIPVEMILGEDIVSEESADE